MYRITQIGGKDRVKHTRIMIAIRNDVVNKNWKRVRTPRPQCYKRFAEPKYANESIRHSLWARAYYQIALPEDPPATPFLVVGDLSKSDQVFGLATCG
jgi:hypothetical protein